MTTKSHKTLTGNQLHENKGVDAATDDTVATASSNTTVWQKLTASHLTGTGNSFGGQLLHIQDRRTSGTGAQSFSSATFNIRVLNTTLTNEISGASLSSNQISLPAGTYWCEAEALHYGADGSQGRLYFYNVSTSTYVLMGVGEYLTATGGGASSTSAASSVIRGRVTATGTQLFELRHYTTGSSAGGSSLNSGQPEVYCDIRLWKIA